MKETAIQRAPWTRQNGAKTVKEPFQTLKSGGLQELVIAQDFYILNLDCLGKLTDNWITVFKDKKLCFASPERSRPKIFSSKYTQGDVTVVLPTPVYKIGRKTFRPSFNETRKSFIDLQPVGSNMVEYLHQAEVTRTYPFVLALGDCSQGFTVISGPALEQSTLLGALDVGFKSYYVFDINFPTVPQHGNSYRPLWISWKEQNTCRIIFFPLYNSG